MTELREKTTECSGSGPAERLGRAAGTRQTERERERKRMQVQSWSEECEPLSVKRSGAVSAERESIRIDAAVCRHWFNLNVAPHWPFTVAAAAPPTPFATVGRQLGY